MNPCLRPACLSDIPLETFDRPGDEPAFRRFNWDAHNALRVLYHAEWQKRGFTESPGFQGNR